MLKMLWTCCLIPSNHTAMMTSTPAVVLRVACSYKCRGDQTPAVTYHCCCNADFWDCVSCRAFLDQHAARCCVLYTSEDVQATHYTLHDGTQLVLKVTSQDRADFEWQQVRGQPSKDHPSTTVIAFAFSRTAWHTGDAVCVRCCRC
jgi:hypothetical protein